MTDHSREVTLELQPCGAHTFLGVCGSVRYMVRNAHGWCAACGSSMDRELHQKTIETQWRLEDEDKARKMADGED